MIKTILAGIIGTIIMSLFMMLGTALGMPELDPPKMLAGMMDTSLIVGWIIHLIIGIIFALLYVFVLSALFKKISGLIIKGALLGIITFIIAQISIPVMGSLLGKMASLEGSMVLLGILSLLGHIVFGIVVTLITKK